MKDELIKSTMSANDQINYPLFVQLSSETSKIHDYAKSLGFECTVIDRKPAVSGENAIQIEMTLTKIVALLSSPEINK